MNNPDSPDSPDSNDHVGQVMFGTAELLDAKRVQSELAARGVKVTLATDPSKCGTGGCKIHAQMWVDTAAVPTLQEYLHEKSQHTLAGLNVNFEQLSSVFDTAATTATCPACGTQFSTHHKECPDCGLVFIVEGMEE